MFTTRETIKPEYIRELESSMNASFDRIRTHPFILEGFNRRLSQQQIVRWVMCAGRESRSFPNVIENMIERTDKPSIVQILEQNLQDEYGQGNPEHAHFMHYLHLLEEIGLSKSNFEEYNEKVGIKLALSLAYNISTQNSQGVSLGYMLVNEGMTNITYSSMKSAFSLYYPNIKTPFFDIHIEVDEKHVSELYKAAIELGEVHLSDILFGVAVGERGMAVLLDEAFGVFDYCA